MSAKDEVGIAQTASGESRPTAMQTGVSGWESFYGLGWYDTDGHAYLTTWIGDMPVVSMLSIDCAPHRIPLWNATVPDGASLIPLPESREELDALVRLRCARRVIGWRMPVPFARNDK